MKKNKNIYMNNIEPKMMKNISNPPTTPPAIPPINGDDFSPEFPIG